MKQPSEEGNMAGPSRAPRYASRQLSERMKEAGEQLTLDFKKATAFEHAGTRGARREESVRRFLSERLPGGYAVTTGLYSMRVTYYRSNWTLLSTGCGIRHSY